MIRVAIFASGAGTNAMKLLHQARNLSQLSIPLILVDQPSSALLQTVPIEFPEVKIVLVEGARDVRENRMLTILREYQIDWCFLAGYMRVVGPTLLSAFPKRMVNIHPSLLPSYPGLNAYEQAFIANDPISGVTIHFVDAGIDTGPIIAQRMFERAKNDKLEDFIERGKRVEWKIYPEILKQLNDHGTL